MSRAISYSALLKLLLPEDWRQSEVYFAGLEREMLRSTPEGELAPGAHPHSWGSALTHPDITVDFAEAQPELVSPTFGSISELLQHMQSLHSFCAQTLPAEERLWLLSMPPQIGQHEIVPASFGSSNTGQLRAVYRQGLAHRYGKQMQVISGIHFNFSWQGDFWKRLHERVGDSRKLTIFRSENYLALMRNYLRMSWLLAYLLGATPAVDRSFLKRLPEELSPWQQNTLLGPYATSLRMSRIGYVNSTRCNSSVNYNSLTDYLSTLYQAITTDCPGFDIIGVFNNDGSYRQLNTHILQIENEHYSLIRPKQPLKPGERPFKALQERGVDYVEVRAVDVQYDHPLGVHPQQLEFLRLFLLYCLLKPNPAISREEELELSFNHQQAALLGRQPGVELRRQGEPVALLDWGLEILAEMQPLAEKLDKATASQGNTPYQDLLQAQEKLLRQPELTPSARALASLTQSGQEFLDWGLTQSAEHLQTLKQTQLEPDFEALMQERVGSSLAEQATLEAEQADQSFADYLKAFSQLKANPLL